jgi:opacity protein-like surface antigen
MKRNLFLVSLLAIASSGAMAQSSNFKAGPYAGIEFGFATVKDQTQSTANSLVSILGGTAAVTQNQSIFDGRIFGGYKIIENIDLELGYTQSSTLSQTATGVSGGGIAYSGKADISYSGFDYSILVRPSLSTGLNGLFFRAGGTYLTQQNKVSLSAGGASASETSNTSGSGYLLGLGYDIPLTKSIDVRAAYNYVGNIAGVANSYSNRFSVGILGKF